MAEEGVRSSRVARKCAEVARIIVKQEIRARVKQISEILKKPENFRTADDTKVLEESPDIVKSAKKRANSRQLNKERKLEVEDDEQVLEDKCSKLAQAIRKSKNLVIYTGAGISTAASIPDYRGPNGVWTLLGKGIQPKAQELSDAEPTFTHLAISTLYKEGKVEHLVSQNCDGLHIRSGFPKERLSELHGNMYLEWCRSCNPPRHYYRLFDVTERTALRRHATGRHCHDCKAELRDTIIHFGEKGPLCPPYRWQEAVNAVESADMILCLGSSLKVLRKYQCLWSVHVPAHKRPDLYIVNLQWTPKDDAAKCKINGKCDFVLRKVMKYLGLAVPDYTRSADPLYHLATQLQSSEDGSSSKRLLSVPDDLQPAQDNLLPKHRRQVQKRRKNTSQRRGRSSDKRLKINRPGVRKKSEKEEIDLGNDSDTLDAPETLEILAVEAQSRVSVNTSQSLAESQEQKHDIKTNTPVIPVVLDQSKNTIGRGCERLMSSCSSSSVTVSTVVKNEHPVCTAMLKHETVVKQEPAASFQTVKTLLGLTNLGRSDIMANSTLHSTAPKCHTVSSPSIVSSCQNVAVSAQSHVVPSFPHVPNNLGYASAFPSYCLLSPTQIKDCQPGAFTSIRPALNRNNQEIKTNVNVCRSEDSVKITSPISAASTMGGIMQSLQVYKSLEDHDYCSLMTKSKEFKDETQDTTSTSYASPVVSVPITKPPTQKTVAELLRERDTSRAQTTVVSSSVKSECKSVKPSLNSALPEQMKVPGIRLPNANIKIQGNILMRQFIPNHHQPMVYATAAVVDMTKLRQFAPRQIAPRQVVPQMMPVRPNSLVSGAGQFLAMPNLTQSVPIQQVQCHPQMRVLPNHNLTPDLTPQIKNSHTSHSNLVTTNSVALSVPDLLPPQFTTLNTGVRPAIPAQSLVPHFVPVPRGTREQPRKTVHFSPAPPVSSQKKFVNVVGKITCDSTNSVKEKSDTTTCYKDNSTPSTVCDKDTSQVKDPSSHLNEEKCHSNVQESLSETTPTSSVSAKEPTSPAKSIPGWFGKGFNSRKGGRRKKGRLT